MRRDLPGCISRQAQGQRDLLIDPGRLAASIALRRLPHADQRVAPASQH
jgi:hypothetical protein